MMLTLVFVVVIFLILIFPHELGHFLSAKASGMKVEKFSIGFGPKIWGKKIKDTEYLVSAFPLGGYVKIAGMEPGENYVERGFSSQSLWKRIGVILSGSAMNYLTSAVLFALVFMIGFETYNFNTTVVGEIISGSPAASVGLKIGDKILEIDGNKVTEWEQMATFVNKEREETLILKIQRGKDILTIPVKPEFNPELNRKLIGVSPSTVLTRYNPLTSFFKGIERVAFVTWLIMSSLFYMIAGKISAEFAGPLGIVGYVSQTVKMGIVPFLSLAALLGVNLGLFNLFPIPALDGGRLVFLLIEGIRGKPVRIEKEALVHYIGFIILITLMFLVTYRDILRMVR